MDNAEKGYSCSLSSQDEVDAGEGKWDAEWACDAPSVDIQWPIDLTSQTVPADITVDLIRQAAHTFSARTGLGWDKPHPRVACRCVDGAILALVRILVLCEFRGEWPEAIGVVIICLLPKPDGGRRPIGFLPSINRW